MRHNQNTEFSISISSECIQRYQLIGENLLITPLHLSRPKGRQHVSVILPYLICLTHMYAYITISRVYIFETFVSRKLVGPRYNIGNEQCEMT